MALRLSDAGRQHLPNIQRAVDQVSETLARIGSKPTQLELARESAHHTMALYLSDMFTAFQRKHRGISMEVLAIDRPVNPMLEGFDIALGMPDRLRRRDR